MPVALAVVALARWAALHLDSRMQKVEPRAGSRRGATGSGAEAGEAGGAHLALPGRTCSLGASAFCLLGSPGLCTGCRCLHVASLLQPPGDSWQPGPALTGAHTQGLTSPACPCPCSRSEGLSQRLRSRQPGASCSCTCGPGCLALQGVLQGGGVRVGQAVRQRRAGGETVGGWGGGGCRRWERYWARCSGSVHSHPWRVAASSMLHAHGAPVPNVHAAPSWLLLNPPAAPHLPSSPLLPQWVYDAWYRHMTPDREFPAEVRLLLSHMFGELAERARAVDWRQLLLEQLPELLTHNIQQYRWVVRLVPCHKLVLVLAGARAALPGPTPCTQLTCIPSAPCLPARLTLADYAWPCLPAPLQAQCGGAWRGCAAGPAASSA
jgi:hypothetical protein